jgi:hypothetical protein
MQHERGWMMDGLILLDELFYVFFFKLELESAWSRNLLCTYFTMMLSMGWLLQYERLDECDAVRA